MSEDGMIYIYGLPTTGKTELRKEIEELGFTVFDTDDWDEISKYIADGDQTSLRELWEDPVRAAKVLDDIDTAIDALRPDYFMTNLHSFFSANSSKPDYAFVRTSEVLLKYLREFRSNTEWSKELVDQWTDSDTFSTIIENIGMNPTILGEGDFMANYVELPDMEE